MIYKSERTVVDELCYKQSHAARAEPDAEQRDLCFQPSGVLNTSHLDRGNIEACGRENGVGEAVTKLVGKDHGLLADANNLCNRGKDRNNDGRFTRTEGMQKFSRVTSRNTPMASRALGKLPKI